MKTKSPSQSHFLAHFFLILLVIIVISPIIFTVASSLKPQAEIYTNVLGLIPENPTLEHYRHIGDSINYWHIVSNTFTVAFIVMTFKVVTSFLVAYAFVFLNFRGKNILYFILVSTIFIPFTVTMIPNYITLSKLGLIDTIFGIVLPQLSDAVGIFLMRQQMRTIPKSFFEVARLEKMPHFSIMGRIVFPSIRPGVISIAIIFFVDAWNEFVWPKLIVKSQDSYTLSLALQLFMGNEGSHEMSLAMAMATATMIIPLILFTIFQRYIMRTFISSGIKG